MTVSTEPSSTVYPPIPVSKSLEWGFTPGASEVVTTAGTQATVVITIPVTPSIPTNGDTIVIWGHTFTVDDSTPFTGSTFEVDASGPQTVVNIVNMLNANLFFARHTTITNTTGSVTITWNNCGAQEKFTGDNMDDTAIVTAGGTMTPTNGTTPVYKDGYRFVARLLHLDNTGEYLPVTEFEGFEPDLTCSAANEILIDFMPAARQILFPILPVLGPDSYIEFGGYNIRKELRLQGIMGHFVVQYGWVYRDSDCQPVSGDFAYTDEVSIINAYFQVDDVYNLRRYWDQHPSSYPGDQTYYRFLTNQPKYHRVCKDSYCWLWFVHVEASTSLRARFTAYHLDGSAYAVYDFTLPNTDDLIQNFNASPVTLSDNHTVDLDDLLYYEVEIQSTGGTAVRTEKLRFIIDQTCCEKTTDVYFQTQLGTIGTIACTIEAEDAIQEGTEVNLQVRTNKTDVEQAGYGGRAFYNSRSYKRVVISARENYNDDQVEFFRSFKWSPHRWLRVPAEDGTFVSKKYIVDPGSVRIFQRGEKVVLEASGYLQDALVQAPTEPTVLPGGALPA